MENQLQQSIKHWYLPLILGILLILAGVWVFATPLASYITLSLFFAVTFLVVGIFQIFHAVNNRNDLEGWGWYLVGGILDLVLGILLISQIGASMLVLAFFVGFGVLFRSIMGIGHSIELKKQGANKISVHDVIVFLSGKNTGKDRQIIYNGYKMPYSYTRKSDGS